MDISPEPDYDCIIIGSGMAGLYTGVELLRRSPKGSHRPRIAMIERDGRVGGRAFTYHGKVAGRAVQWEAGAGRISQDHELLLGLMRRYRRKWIPIGASIQFKGSAMDTCFQENAFEPAIPVMLDVLAGLPAEVLARSTIRQLLTRIHGPAATDNYLLRFPYRAELDIMRADRALELFRAEMRAHEGYGICEGGLSTVTEALAEDFQRRGGELMLGRTLQNVVQEAKGADSGLVRCFFKGSGDSSADPLTARHVVLAIPCVAAAELPALADWKTLRHLTMTPLLRFYGVFPKGGPAGDDKLWYENGGRIITAGHVRYMIPGSADIGSAQMSYTDSQDATYWMERIAARGEEAVGREIVQELREWVDPRIPTPLFMKAHAWPHGVSYWLPGSYSPEEESRSAVRPLPEALPGVWLCGESYSLRQGWIEGALEHAELMLKGLEKALKISAHTKGKARHAR
jgi:hypothetical protein